MLSGLVFEPLVEPFLKDTAPDTDNIQGVMFFLSIAVVADSSESPAIDSFRRIAGQSGQ